MFPLDFRCIRMENSGNLVDAAALNESGSKKRFDSYLILIIFRFGLSDLIFLVSILSTFGLVVLGQNPAAYLGQKLVGRK